MSSKMPKTVQINEFSDQDVLTQWKSLEITDREDTHASSNINHVLREKSMSLNEKMRLGENASRGSEISLSPVRDTAAAGITWSPQTKRLADIGSTSYPSSVHHQLESRSTTAAHINSSLLMNVSMTEDTYALVEAAEKGDPDKVKTVLRDGSVDPDFKRNATFRTALERACGYGQVDVVIELIENGADPEQTSATGRTLLHGACTGGHADIVQILVDFIQDINTVDRIGRSAVHQAAFNGETACLAVLADKGADLNLADNHGKTPSHLAAERNHPAILEYLTERGVDTELGDDRDKKPSHYAAIHGGLECLVFLVQIDCDMTKVDNVGCFPAHYAAAHDHIDCLRYLIKTGTSLDVKDNSGRTLTHMAAQHGAMTCIHWLFEKGADPYVKDGQGNTPLHMAAIGGHAKCFNCCLQHNGSLEILNKREETALDAARRFGHPVVMDKAVNNEVQCLHCVSKYEVLEWEKSHQPTKVQRSVNSSKKIIYRSPVPPAKKELSRAELNRIKREKREAEQSKDDNLPKRDLAAKYFGQHFEGMWQVTGK